MNKKKAQINLFNPILGLNVFLSDRKPMIEKNLFQTFINQKFPDEILEIRNLLISKNPKYSYHFFSDEDILDFIKTYYDNEVFSAYCKINIGAAKADFWRYLVLNHYGGVYLDIDSLIEIPLDCFINVEDKAILTREKNPNHFVQWCLMIKKEHPILRKVIYKVIKKINEQKESRLDYITGPPVFSEAIEELYNDLGFHSIYYTDDSKINALMDVNSDRYARFIGTDYDNPSFIFKHRHAKLIYMRKVHWREEQKEKPVVKKLNFFKRIARGLTS